MELFGPSNVRINGRIRETRRETPVDVQAATPTREERLRAFVNSALEEYGLPSRSASGGTDPSGPCFDIHQRCPSPPSSAFRTL